MSSGIEDIGCREPTTAGNRSTPPELGRDWRKNWRKNDPPLIVFHGAEPFVPSTVRNRALAAWESAGMEPIGLHECRHSFASMLIDAGGNPKALREALGHASIQMTWDKYGHLMPGGREELRERIDCYLRDRLNSANAGLTLT